MKALFIILTVALLAVATGLGGCAETATGDGDRPGETQEQQEQATETGDRRPESQKQQRERTEIPVWLPIPPSLATISRKSGATMTGQVTGLDSQNITLSAENVSQKLPIGEVNQLAYSGDLYISVSGGSRKIRGGEQEAEPIVWQVPAIALELKDPTTGEALVRLGEAVDSDYLRDYLDIAQTSIYVVKKIVFESPEAIEITVVPVDKIRERG